MVHHRRPIFGSPQSLCFDRQLGLFPTWFEGRQGWGSYHGSNNDGPRAPKKQQEKLRKAEGAVAAASAVVVGKNGGGVVEGEDLGTDLTVDLTTVTDFDNSSLEDTLTTAGL